MYTTLTCAVGYSTAVAGPRLVYRLILANDVPLGGLLSFSTCGLTANNTVLYLGTGCPTWYGSFGCLRGNDNGAPACGGNALASSLSHIAASSVYFVQVGEVSGAAFSTGLRWSYTLPSASPSATRSRTRSRAAASRSATASKSRSRKAKRA